MKKTLAMLLAVALAIGAAVLPALAEETDKTTDQVSSATVQAGNGGQDGRQVPDRNQSGQMPGNGQMPQAPGRNGSMPGGGQMPDRNQNGQMPEVPGQNTPNSQQTLPGNGTRNMNHGHRFGGQHGRIDGTQADCSGKQMIFDRLLAEGVITQEIYDAITNYMKEHAPQQPENGVSPAKSSESPELPDGTSPAEGSEPPALPDGASPDGETVSPEEQMLKDLLESGVISQEQYELLLTKVTTDDAVPGSAG